MSPQKTVYVHPERGPLPLGARPPIVGQPTVKYARVRAPGVPVAPQECDSRQYLMGKYNLSSWWTSMYGNDVYGDCVAVWLANALQLQHVQQTGTPLETTREEVVQWYLKQDNGFDYGMIPNVAAQAVRDQGITCAGKLRHIYTWAEVDYSNFEELRQAIWYLLSIGLELALPVSARQQVGTFWTVVDGPDSAPGSWGYHQVNVPKYKFQLNQGVLTCETWGTDQQMDLGFLLKYGLGAWALVPAVETLDPVVFAVSVPELVKATEEISNVPNEPTITSIDVTQGKQGTSVTVRVLGTNFAVDSLLFFGLGTTVYTWQALSAVEGIAVVIIAPDAMVGTWPVTIANGQGAFGYLTGGGFEILPGDNPPPIPPPPPPPPPKPNPCVLGNGVAKVINVVPWALGREGRLHYMNPSKKRKN